MFVDENGDLINPLAWQVWRSRREEDGLVYDAVEAGSRYGELVSLNGGRDFEKILREWAEAKVVLETRWIVGLADKPERGSSQEVHDPKHSLMLSEESLSSSIDPTNSYPEYEDDLQVFHWPRNATGYYRGLWMKIPRNSSEDEKYATPNSDDISLWTQHQLQRKEEDVSLFILPSKNTTNNEAGSATQGLNTASVLPNATLNKDDTNPTLSLINEAGRVAFQLYSRPIPAMTELSIVDGLVKLYDGMTTSFVSRRTDVLLRVRGVIIHSSGKMSLVSSSVANDVSLEKEKIKSVLGIKRVDSGDSEAERLHSNGYYEHVEEENVDEITDRLRHRRLQDLLNAFLSHPDTTEQSRQDSAFKGLFHDASMILSEIRDDVMELYSSQYAHEIVSTQAMKDFGWDVLQSVGEDDTYELHSEFQERHVRQTRTLQSMELNATDVVEKSDSNEANVTLGTEEPSDQSDELQLNASHTHDDGPISRSAASTQEGLSQARISAIPVQQSKTADIIPLVTHRSATSTQAQSAQAQDSNIITDKQHIEQKYAYPFPYVCDDANDSIKKSSSPASRRLPARELALEANAANCEFEMNIDIHKLQWTFDEWKSAVLQLFRTVQAFNPYLKRFDRETERLKRSQILNLKSQVGFTDDSIKEALVMAMSGTIASTNCNFSSFVNVTAIRTNWEHTTAKAINYSFYMMLTCLGQIVVLLRQLLHTQAQSAASNVSLICVGWQTVLDAILCIAHIFLCLGE
jgi:hypothetical protein